MNPIPPRLAREYKAAGSQRELARRLKVNPKYVHDLLVKGIEPKNPEVRAALYLPRSTRPRRPRPPTPAWLQPIKRGIRKLAKQTRKAINDR